MKYPGIKGLDHLALAVKDTEAALKIWRDRFGFPVVHQEAVNEDTVLLTHLDLGNTHLQLVQPLVANHPLQDWLAKHGDGLHHFCFTVDDVDTAKSECLDAGLACPASPHQGIKGNRALFLDKDGTGGPQVEFTGQ